MLLIRQLIPPLIRYTQRFYAHKAVSSATSKKAMKQVHKEQLLHVNRNAKITIRSDIYMKIRAGDVLQYPEGTAIHSKLYGHPEKNLSADVKISVSENEQDVEIVCKKLHEDSNCHCSLALPILADVHIETKDSVRVENIYNQELKIKAQKDITTKDIKSANIELLSEGGNITCEGLFLADVSSVEVKGNGKIKLDKPQGNLLECKTTTGGIQTNSCYVESSKFSTDTGAMLLKHVHKKSQVFVNKHGDLKISGFHGNLFVRSNGGNMNLQLSEIEGENVVMAEDLEHAIVNISDSIEERSFIEITATEVLLDSPLSHLSDGLNADSTVFQMSTEHGNNNKLMICTKCSLKLGKLSWAESMKLTLGAKEQ